MSHTHVPIYCVASHARVYTHVDTLFLIHRGLFIHFLFTGAPLFFFHEGLLLFLFTGAFYVDTGDPVHDSGIFEFYDPRGVLWCI